MAIAIPPLPEPSSLVTTRPVRPTACLNSRACTSALLPVVASTTNKDLVRGLFIVLSEEFGQPFPTLASGYVSYAGGPRCRRSGIRYCACWPRNRHRNRGPLDQRCIRRPRLDLEAVGPYLELLDGGGSEGVSGGEHDGMPILFQKISEFRRRSRLACPINTDHQDDLRPVRQRSELRISDRKNLFDVAPGSLDDIIRGNFDRALLQFLQRCEASSARRDPPGSGFPQVHPNRRTCRKPVQQIFEKSQCHDGHGSKGEERS